MAGTAMIVGAVVGAVAAIGTGVMSYMQGSASAAQARSQSDAARQQESYARAMAARNQQLSEYAAQSAEAKGTYEAGLAKERQRKLLSKQIALTGASGMDMYGSPLEVMGQSWGEGERDVNTILYNAHYDAWKYRTSGETSLIEGSNQANRYGMEATNYDTNASNTSLFAPISAGLGIMNAGSSILTAYGKYKYYSGGGKATPEP
jgi:hypothetical protein